MSTQTAVASKKKWFALVGGTACAVVAAGVLIQMFKAPGADAVEQPAPATARAADTSGYVGRVNRQLITYSELADECVARHGQEVLENIINRMIIQQACETRNVTVAASDVDQEIIKIAKRFNLPVDTWFEMLRTERNMTPEQYRRDVIWPMLSLKKLAGENVTVKDADIQRAFVREYGPRVKAKMIMLDNLRRAQTIWEQVAKTPDDFERLARENSIEPNSRALGGAIPPIRRSGTPENEAIEKAAFTLRTGEISGVVQIGLNRYVIVLCEGRTEPIVTDLELVRAELHDMLVEEQVQKAVAEVFEKIKSEAQIDNYVTRRTTGGVQQTSGQKSAPAPGTSPIAPAAATNAPRPTTTAPTSPTQPAPRRTN